MSRFRSSPHYVRRLILLAYVGTFIGSFMVGGYFLYIDLPPADTSPSGMHRRILTMLALNVLGYVFFGIGLKFATSGLQSWENRIHAGLSPSEVPMEVRRRALRLIPRVALAGIATWALIALLALALSPYGPGGIHRGIRVMLTILGVGGVVGPALIYFAADLAWRPAIRTFFPDGRLSDAVALRRHLLVRLVTAFLLTGVWLPALLVAASLNHSVPMIGKTYSLNTFRNTLAVEIALLGFCVYVSVALAFLVTNGITRPLHALQDAMARVERDDLTAEVPVTTYDELGYLGERFNQMTAGLRERDHIRQMFGQYVTTQVAEAVLHGHIKLGGERTEVTVLMTDLRDFTALCESMEPEELVGLLNRYFDAMIDAIMEFGGTLDKFVGDAIVTVFNAPLAQADHPRCAVLTALRMRERLAAFNAEQQRHGMPVLRMGIGIHTGPAVVGNIGSEGKRVEYTAMGDTVNVAARLESLTKEVAADICLSAETYSQVRDSVLVEAPFSTTVKGRKAPITAHSLIGLRPSAALEAAGAQSSTEPEQAGVATVRLPALRRRILQQYKDA